MPRLRKYGRLAAVAFLLTGGFLARASESGAPTESDVVARIRTLVVPSPYRISSAARQGTIRYRVSEGDSASAWLWPQTGEQRVARAGTDAELTICRDCGREAAPSEAELRRYLVPNAWLESDDRNIIAFARAARGGSVDARMRRLVTAVQTRLSGAVSYRGYHTAREALALRSGDCTEYALLLAAAGRARGIPTRVVAGLGYGSRFVGQAHVFGPHMWVQAWNGERWVSYDAGLGSFDSGHIALAVGDGSPESLRGALQTIARLRIVDAAGLLPAQ